MLAGGAYACYLLAAALAASGPVGAALLAVAAAWTAASLAAAWLAPVPAPRGGGAGRGSASTVGGASGSSNHGSDAPLKHE